MISERQQEQASLYVLGALAAIESEAFQIELRADADLRELVRGFERATSLVAMAVPAAEPPRELRDRILRRIRTDEHSAPARSPAPRDVVPGHFFVEANDPAGWKQLPVPGASLKLLTADRARGYVVLLGRLAPGARYPAHTHEGSEDLYLLSGDLHVGNRRLMPGDFHHSDPGTRHPDNHSVDGCTLLAVVSTDHAMAKFVLA